MAIISQTTWDKFTQEEKEKILKKYQEVRIDKEIKTDFNKWMAGRADEFEELFGKENLQQKKLTYENVARELFMDKQMYWINNKGNVCQGVGIVSIESAINCTSEKQAEKLLAINRLLNIAKFLNGNDWKPDEAEGKLWAIGIEKYNKTIMPVEVGAYDYRTEIVYFRTQPLAYQAIQILGEDTVRLALSSDF